MSIAIGWKFCICVFEHSYRLEVLSSLSWWVEASGQAAVPLDGLQARATLPDTLPCC